MTKKDDTAAQAEKNENQSKGVTTDQGAAANQKNQARQALMALGCDEKDCDSLEKHAEMQGLDLSDLMPKILRALPLLLQLVSIFSEESAGVQKGPGTKKPAPKPDIG